jgi:hypothetical protein
MDKKLRATFAPDPDAESIGELFVEVSASPFAGASSAWFQHKELERFADALESSYPLDISSPITLVGGVWARLESRIEQQLVAFTVYPVGSRGVVGFRVALATPWSDQWPEARSRVEVELLTSYEGLRSFSRGLRGIVCGEAEEALLAADEG